MLEYLAAAQKWDRRNPETLRFLTTDINSDPRTGKRHFITDPLSDAEFEIWKDEHVRQIKQRLRWMRAREELRRGPVDGYNLECKLATLQRAIRRKAQYPRNASQLTHNFNQQQRKILYCLLDDIEENIPVRRLVNQQDAYNRISTYRKKR